MSARPFEPGVYAAGQPDPDELARYARDGVRSVINLRAPTESAGYDEAGEARRLDLHYISLPIAGAADLTHANAATFGRALDDARTRGAVLIHCGSSNRVGAMIALDAALNRGIGLEDALVRGRAAGLSSLEPAVVAAVQAEGASA